MNLIMNPSTGISLTKTKFVHVMYIYLEFGFTVLKLSALFDHINSNIFDQEDKWRRPDFSTKST